MARPRERKRPRARRRFNSTAAQMWAPPQTSAKTPIRTNTAAVRLAAKSTRLATGASSSARAPAASSSIDTPTSIASAPHSVARVPSRLTCRSNYPESPGGRDNDVQLHARRSVRPLCNGKAESSAVTDTGRDGNLNGMPQQLEPAAAASHAGLSPRLAAPAAVSARALHGDVERDGDAVSGFVAGQLHRGAERIWTLVGQERAP